MIQKVSEFSGRETVSLDEVIDLLNDLLRADPIAVSGLCLRRVPCAQALSAHPTLQVHHPHAGRTELGVVGLLNALFGTLQADRSRGGITVNVVGGPGAQRIRSFERTAPKSGLPPDDGRKPVGPLPARRRRAARPAGVLESPRPAPRRKEKPDAPAAE